MGENTENHSFYKPATDETGWGNKVGSNFDSLDTDTLIKDTFANRPADPPSDTWFLATDRRIFYRYDGTSWDAIAGAGTASNPLPEQHVTKTTTEDVNTTKYADTLSEAQTLIDENSGNINLDAQGGLKIVLKEKTYSPSADDLPVTLGDGVIIEGQGTAATKIDVSGIGKTVFEFDRSTGNGRKAVIRDLMVVGDKTAGSVGVHFTDIHQWSISDCYFANLEDGILLDGTFVGQIRNTHSRRHSQDGIRTDSTSDGDPDELTIIGGLFENNGRHGGNFTGVSGLTCHGVYFINNGEFGTVTDNISGGSFKGCMWESNGGSLSRGGANNPAEIGLSWDPDNFTETRSVSIRDCHINPTDGGTVVVAGQVVNCSFSNNRIRGDSKTVTGVEIHGEAQGFEMRNNDFRNTDTVLTRAVTAGSMFAEDVNDGIWRDVDFGDLDKLESAANGLNISDTRNKITVELTQDHSENDRPIQGGNYPEWTRFVGVGQDGPEMEATGDGNRAVRLAKAGQSVENIRAKASTTNGVAVEARFNNRHTIRDVRVTQADTAFRGSDNDNEFINCRVESGSVTTAGDDDGSDNRWIGCHFAVDISGATRPLIDGVAIDSADLGGADGSISPTDKGLVSKYKIRVDAGGSNSNLQGIDNIAREGVTAVIIHTGGENVVLEDDATASNPLKNQSGANDTLDANGEMAVYEYDAQSSAWRQIALNQQA